MRHIQTTSQIKTTKDTNLRRFNTYFDGVLEDCTLLFSDSHKPSLTWSKRSANMVADKIARLVFDFREQYWLEDAPYQVAILINNDV